MNTPNERDKTKGLRPHFDVSPKIIKVRNEQGLSQKELASKTGIQRSNISRLESGSYNPSIDLLLQVAKGLDMELHIEFRPPKASTT